eukprot:g16751.t1
MSGLRRPGGFLRSLRSPGSAAAESSARIGTSTVARPRAPPSGEKTGTAGGAKTASAGTTAVGPLLSRAQGRENEASKPAAKPPAKAGAPSPGTGGAPPALTQRAGTVGASGAPPKAAASPPVRPGAATGAPPPAGMLAILGGMSDFLSSVSNQPGGYSEEQRRGCIACALRLGKPELVNVLAKLHSLAASCWAHSSSDAAALKALAVLLGVPANKDPLEDAIAWRLARPTPRPPEVWKKEHRQTALALLLKAPPNSDSEADLVLKLLKSVASWATAALCVLLAAPAGAQPQRTSLDEAKQGAVVTLAEHVASGKVGKGKTYPGLEICALLLGCDAKEAAILSQASSVPWAKAAQSAIKTVAGLESAPAKPAESPSSAQQVSPAPPLDLSKVKALLKESHERQMLGYAAPGRRA